MPRNLRENNNLLSTAFTISNHTDDRAMDCDAAADAEIADVLGSLIRDLVQQGIINGTVTE